MQALLDHRVPVDSVALWWLGQAGYVVRCGGLTVAIDPYLSDSGAQPDGRFARLYAPPLAPRDLAVDVLLITHNHIDHLDPVTLAAYRPRATTTFVAPRHAAARLRALGFPAERIVVVNAGDTWTHGPLTLRGTFCLPTDPSVLDTTGYHLAFANGRSLWFVSDTQWHPYIAEAAPRDPAPEALLLPINGKFGNLTVEQAVELTRLVRPRLVFPNHFDCMSLNTEDPRAFAFFLEKRVPGPACVVPARLAPVLWGPANTPVVR